jgi:hypothetical protein
MNDDDQVMGELHKNILCYPASTTQDSLPVKVIVLEMRAKEGGTEYKFMTIDTARKLRQDIGEAFVEILDEWQKEL